LRDYYRDKLSKLLQIADDEAFIQLLWAVHTLQSDTPKAASGYIQLSSVPNAAITTDMRSSFYIREWELETLANELMTTKKKPHIRNGKHRTLNCYNFRSLSDCVNTPRKLENIEFSFNKKNQSIFVELGRIASRQFGWQTGYANAANFFRNAYIYGQGKCASYFLSTYEISFNRFSQIGFMIYVSLKNSPLTKYDLVWTNLGVTQIEFEKVLELLSLPYSDAVSLAIEKRNGVFHTADRPSILRQVPCLRFGIKNERLRAPLPELVIDRITSGVFYDVVNGGGKIREEYGKRFEEYCYNYFLRSFLLSNWTREYKYRKSKNVYDTPDIICQKNNKIEIAIECKSTRMSQAAMFGVNPIEARGFEDLAKAIFQLWSFFSDCRRGHTGQNLSDSSFGMVLTLDNWLVMADSHREEVFKMAKAIASERDIEILEEDRKPIAFVTIAEIERTLAFATEDTFSAAALRSTEIEYFGWRLDGLHKKLFQSEEQIPKKYPFLDELGDILPWWKDFELRENATPQSSV
jgi:hypothetical protein